MMRTNPNPRSAFTLVELLVVIAIIAILAALVIGVAAKATQSATTSKVNAALHAIETAIADYHADHGYYPRDNQKGNPAVNPLYYELRGTIYEGTSFRAPKGHSISVTMVNNAFGIDGFGNSRPAGQEPKDHFTKMEEEWARDIPYATGTLRILAVPFEWSGTMGPPPIPNTSVNPWFYQSTHPTNNTDSYDLWGHVSVGGSVKTFSNWNK